LRKKSWQGSDRQAWIEGAWFGNLTREFIKLNGKVIDFTEIRINKWCLGLNFDGISKRKLSE
jgi:hypothetical protein